MAAVAALSPLVTREDSVILHPSGEGAGHTKGEGLAGSMGRDSGLL